MRAIFDEIGGDGQSWIWELPDGTTNSNQSFTISPYGSGDAGTYTVTVTDSNGCTSSCSVDLIIPLADTEENSSFYIDPLYKLYPNPSSGELILFIKNKWDKKQVAVRIFDTSNRILRTDNYMLSVEENLIDLDYSGFTSGIYYLVIEYGNKQLIEKISIINN